MKIFLKIFIALFLSHIKLLGHCQIPCGIYSDAVQIIQIKEHLTTIEKSISMIKKLSGEYDPQSNNQLIRWISTKEEHAQKIQDVISQYFLTQRIKQNSKNYENELITLHQLLISVMKCKQSINVENVKKSLELLEDFSDLYLDEHDLEHLKDFENLIKQ
tara:strand:+ start:2607 stop:3086 length:480 start_codon:yes stop_codon:yes gene_type:complete